MKSQGKNRISLRLKLFFVFSFVSLVYFFFYWSVLNSIESSLEKVEFPQESLDLKQTEESFFQRISAHISNTSLVNMDENRANAAAQFHIVFSTDCSPYQDWQSLLVFYSAYNVGQKGAITRIASGCDEAKQLYLNDLYKKLWGKQPYRAHFTPNYKSDKRTGASYDFYNKPFGVRHFLENFKGSQNLIIALIDPDFIFMRPLSANLTDQPSNIFYNRRPSHHFKVKDIPKLIAEGNPAAMRYGLGAAWTRPIHRCI